MSAARFHYAIRHADRALVLSQQLTGWLTHAPLLEEEVALANIALDLLGQARALYTYAAEVEGAGRTADDLAYWRDDRAFRNVLLVEQANGDFADTMARQLLHDAWAGLWWTAMGASSDPYLAALAAKAVKETTYHLRHCSSWVVRLGDGTAESRHRMQGAFDRLWRYTGELFEADGVERTLIADGVAVEPAELRGPWLARVERVLTEATLVLPTHPPDGAMATGGRAGRHSEAFAFLIGELQVVARAHPGVAW